MHGHRVTSCHKKMIIFRQHGGPDKNRIDRTGKKAVEYFTKVIINPLIMTAMRQDYAAVRGRGNMPPVAVLKRASAASIM